MKTNLQLMILAVALLFLPHAIFAQAPTLGTAANFVLFSSDGAVTNSGVSQYTGDIGTNNGSNTGFGNVNGVMNSANGATAQAAADLLIAYNQLNSTIATLFPSNLMGNGDTLDGGIYSIGSATVLNGILTLDANGDQGAVFIFKIGGSLSTGPGAKVVLINGAKACNIFWKIEGLVSMAAGTTMRGTIIANNAAINMNAGDTLEGRALSTTGAVILNGTFAYTPIGCGTPTLTGPIAPTLATTEAYALFTGDGQVSNAGITTIVGDVGTNNGSTTGFDSLLVTGTIHPGPDSSTFHAAADLLNMYTYINLLPNDIELLYPAQFGSNLILTPHTYILNAATVLTDSLYLNAQGNPAAIFVIKINGALSTGINSRVVLINGAQAQNVYWRVNGAATFNNFSVFKGTVLANNTTLNTGTSIDGRALATIGAIATAGVTVTIPGAPVTINDLIISTTTDAGGTYNNVTVTSTGNATLTGNLLVLGNMIVQTGGKLNTGNNLVEGNNGFTLNTGATLTINAASGITTAGATGDIRVTGTRVYDAGATYIYGGNLAQVTGNALPAAVDSLWIDNINSVSLSGAQTINQKLTLGNGNLNTGVYDLTIAPAGSISGASANGYVATDDAAAISGTLKRTVTSAGAAILFPVGSNVWKGSYTPATVTMPSGTTDIISVGVFTGVMKAGFTGAPITSHQVNRSWVISEAVAGGSNVTVELQWDDSMELASFIRSKTGIAHYSGSTWNTPLPAAYNAAIGSNPYTTSRSGITSFSIFIVGDSTINATLPVTLLSFSGTKVNADAVLTWKTATELNNSHFEVERSTDGKTYQMIGIRKGAGNSTTLNGYSFTDANIVSANAPVLYYRLKQVDFDGKTTSYNPIAIKLSQAKGDFNVTTFPNPIVKDLQLQMVNSEAGTMNIIIYDMQGTNVIQKNIRIETGMSNITIDNLDTLTDGVYFMYATLNGNIYRQKLVKMAY